MPPSTANSSCPACLKGFSSSANVRRHQEKDPICRIHRDKAHQKALKAAREKRQAYSQLPVQSDNNCDTYRRNGLTSTMAIWHWKLHSLWTTLMPWPHHVYQSFPDRRAEITEEETNSDISAGLGGLTHCQPQSGPVLDHSRRPWYQQFPYYRSQKAGQPISLQPGKTAFEKIEDSQVLQYGEVLGPFKDDEEWELAKWLIKNVGHTQADSFLKLPIVRSYPCLIRA